MTVLFAGGERYTRSSASGVLVGLFAARRPLLLALLVLATAYLPGLWSRGLWHVDEVRYVEVARETTLPGAGLALRLNGEVYPEKPPLFFWSIAAAEKLIGDWSMAGRAVVLAAALAAAALTFAAARLLLGDARAAGWSVLVLVTAAFFIDRGQRAMIDPFLVPWTLLGVLGLLKAALQRGVGRWAWIAAAALGTTGGCLTKGPVGLLLPVVGAVAAGSMAFGRRGISITAIVVSVLAAAAATLTWLWFASRQAGEWLWDYMLYEQSAGRAVDAFAHGEPWHYYLERLPPHLLPWLLLLPAALVLPWLGRRRAAAVADAGPSGARAAVLWAVAGLAVFSAFSAKRSGYVLPLVPPLCIAVGWALRGLERAPATTLWRRWVAWPLWILPPVLIGLGLVALLNVPLRALAQGGLDERGQRLLMHLPAGAGVATTIAGAMVLALGVWGWRGCRERPLRPVSALALACGVAMVVAHAFWMPAIDRERSSTPFASAIEELVPDVAHLALLDNALDGVVNLATGELHHDVVPAEDLPTRTDASGTLWLVADQRQWQHKVPDALRARFEIVAGPELGDGELLLLREAAP